VSEPTNARGKRDILRVKVDRITRLVVVTGSLESDRYDSMKCLILLYLDEKRGELSLHLCWVYIDQTASPALSGSFTNIT
jgi:hypothetical protein